MSDLVCARKICSNLESFVETEVRKLVHKCKLTAPVRLELRFVDRVVYIDVDDGEAEFDISKYTTVPVL